MFKTATEAKCDGSTLTVSFHRAAPPLIWRFDLERNHSFTLALQGEEGEWELGVTSPKGDFYPVARFESEDDAKEAFGKTGHVLAHGKGQTMTVGRAIKWLMMAVIGIAVLVAVCGLLASRGTMGLPGPGGHPMGVPVSADDVLTPPQ